ncbi:MAG: V-type ATP synthase subunit D [Methanomicrobia archaeon]|nr:V-type ATP synthase subunit D [Methanomicrobia archaeon]
MKEIKPTRSALLRLNRRILLAKRGHRLLKEKRDVLVIEFFSIFEDQKYLRRKVNEDLKEAFKLYAKLKTVDRDIEKLASVLSRTQGPEIEIKRKNVMGVTVPLINLKKEKKNLLDRGYNIYTSSVLLDEVYDRFAEILKDIVRLGEIEKSVKLLAKEIEKTKRRVNALEYILIPALEEKRRFIQFQLDEREREDFFRMKRVKTLIKTVQQ